MRRRVRFCAANAETLRIQRRERRMFTTQANRHFQVPGRGSTKPSKLLVDWYMITSPESLLRTWVWHFRNLAGSNGDYTGLEELQKRVEALARESMGIEDYLFDSPFTVQEVELAIRQKAPGPDNLSAEHLIEGGMWVAIWLTDILNEVTELEFLLGSLKLLVVLVYKGNEKDPMLVEM